MDVHIVNRCDFKKNQTIDNRYVVLKVLGEGAFGKVYKVYKVGGDVNNVYALKLLKLWEVPENIRKGLIDRFDMEFETGQITSDYLVHSLDHGIVEGNPYIVMEFCSGGDLSQFIDDSSNQHTPPDNLSTFSLHILTGLNDLHISGKVHRDLKPENVLLKSDNWAVLTDFGISGDRNKRMTERNLLGKPTQIFGTYAYMPPEQVQRMKGDATVLPTTDIFSFGVMLYQLLVGSLPFGPLNDHNDLVEYQRNAANGIWNRNQLHRSHIERQWEAIIEGCLIPDYKQRIQRTVEIIRMLPECSDVSVPSSFESTGNDFLLRVMQGEEYGKIYKLSDFVKKNNSILTLGREECNSIYIHEFQSCYISRRHCTLEFDEDTNSWFVRDGQWIRRNNYANTTGWNGSWTRSTNGTYINSTEVSDFGMKIQSGDIISIGDVKLRVENY